MNLSVKYKELLEVDVLKKLNDERVLDVSYDENLGRFVISELCDYYFETTIDKNEAFELATLFKNIHEFYESNELEIIELQKKRLLEDAEAKRLSELKKLERETPKYTYTIVKSMFENSQLLSTSKFNVVDDLEFINNGFLINGYESVDDKLICYLNDNLRYEVTIKEYDN